MRKNLTCAAYSITDLRAPIKSKASVKSLLKIILNQNAIQNILILFVEG